MAQNKQGETAVIAGHFHEVLDERDFPLFNIKAKLKVL